MSSFHREGRHFLRTALGGTISSYVTDFQTVSLNTLSALIISRPSVSFSLITIYDCVPIECHLQYNTIQYNTIQYNTIKYNTIQYNTIQYNTIKYNTIQYDTIRYNTIQYNTIQYNTTQYD